MLIYQGENGQLEFNLTGMFPMEVPDVKVSKDGDDVSVLIGSTELRTYVTPSSQELAGD